MSFRRFDCVNSLAAFYRRAWPVIEPNRPMYWGWYLDAICEHLEAVIAGQISHLLITIPPNTGKSRLVACALPAWVWATNPNYRFLYVSNSDSLASVESMACRRVIESDWFRHTFGIRWKLSDVQNQKAWYETTAGGHRIAKGIGSNVTGRKGDAIITDDANDAQKVQSEADRRNVNQKYDNAVYDRVIDMKKGARVIIGQRTHANDLIGHCKEQGIWEELKIPEEFDGKRLTLSTGWQDPRTKIGELLRPRQFGPVQARQLRRKNLLGYQAKHQQEPRSPEGIRFRRAWFDTRWRYDGDGQHIIIQDGRGEYRFHPFKNTDIKMGFVERFGTADGAASGSTASDYTVVSTWIITKRYDLIWLGCKRFRAEIPEQPDILEAEYRKWLMQWCGVEAAFSNRALLQFAQRRAMIIRQLNPDGDKLARATPAIVLSESRRVYLPDEAAAKSTGFPLEEVMNEITAFTGDDKQDEHDDVVDTFSYAVEHFNKAEGGGGSGGPTAAAPPAANAWQQRVQPKQIKGKPWQ